jgi:hypothetical protein
VYFHDSASHVPTPVSPACGDHVELPAQRARAHVVRAHVAPRRLLVSELVERRHAEHDDVADDERGAGPRVAHVLAEACGQIHAAVLAEVGVGLARLRVQREQVLAVLDEDPRVAAVAPVADPARRRAAVAVLAGLERRLDPNGLAGAGIERLDEADAVRGIEHAADHERRAAEALRGAHVRRLREDRRIERGSRPRDAKPRDVALVDLIERGVFRARGVAVVGAPFAVRRAALRAGGKREERSGDERGCAHER